MGRALLITRPDHDTPTRYLFAWSEEYIASAQERGIKVLDLCKKKANKTEFESYIVKFSPKFIVFNGHGKEDRVSGYKDQPLVIAGENEELLDAKIVYAISCRSAKKLGMKSIRSGVISYTGYTEEFILGTDVNLESRPLEDETAKLFLEHSLVFVNTVIKGNSVSNAYKRAKTSLKNNINKLLSSESPDSAMVVWLWWDLQNFVSLGDKSAKF